MENFNKSNENKIPKETLTPNEAISAVENLNKQEEKISIEELHSLIKKLNTEINDKEPKLSKIEEDLNKTKDKIPKVDGRYEDQAYKEFCDSLGDYDQKINLLEKLQKELSAEFINNSNEANDAKIKNQISLLSELVIDIKRLKTGSTEYDNNQFLKRSREVLPQLSFLKGNLESLNSKYREYIKEKIANNLTLESIKNDPKTIALQGEISGLEESYKKMSDEVANLKLDRYNALIQVSKIEEDHK